MVLNFSAGTLLGRLLRLAWRDFATVTRPVGFRVVVAVLAVLALFYHVLWQEIDFLGMAKLPLTYEMAIAREPMSVYLFVLFAIWTIETLFKDRTVRIWEVTESLPVPTWVLFLSRFIAMAAVSLVFVGVLLAVGLLVQLGRGFTDIDWALYLHDLLLYRLGWLTYLHVIALALFVGAVLNNRYLAHAVTIGILLFVFIALISGMIEEYRYLYAYVPGVEEYSEMNGYGIFAVSGFWYGLMWSFLAAALILLAFGLWNRGAPGHWSRGSACCRADYLMSVLPAWSQRSRPLAMPGPTSITTSMSSRTTNHPPKRTTKRPPTKPPTNGCDRYRNQSPRISTFAWIFTRTSGGSTWPWSCCSKMTATPPSRPCILNIPSSPAWRSWKRGGTGQGARSP
ncbi:hypothetical protein CAI21_16935 [Alkalilimnicola ehrlichii]|uniref:Uncharacterized protein n=1 Tax=Alkalilimnicola ehrlichii TaxID=351052 RepID=A0A3E0WKW0_9GAMM|nr:ABC transporter permease [Alkalilimnicola ehrlichii]RFA26376.1 hypothetical protein CAI21_16935 [Alkalilimnicola ehrlichii]RFA33438.1 hypothetical protein CAL65_17415 [Alkalilimnicola ehrlichii]